MKNQGVGLAVVMAAGGRLPTTPPWCDVTESFTFFFFFYRGPGVEVCVGSVPANISNQGFCKPPQFKTTFLYSLSQENLFS